MPSASPCVISALIRLIQSWTTHLRCLIIGHVKKPSQLLMSRQLNEFSNACPLHRIIRISFFLRPQNYKSSDYLAFPLQILLAFQLWIQEIVRASDCWRSRAHSNLKKSIRKNSPKRKDEYERWETISSPCETFLASKSALYFFAHSKTFNISVIN